MRSTDLLSLANVNPDAGFAVQMSIDENLLDLQVVSFQAALLYTSSKGAEAFVGSCDVVSRDADCDLVCCCRRAEDPRAHAVSAGGQFSVRHLRRS